MYTESLLCIGCEKISTTSRHPDDPEKPFCVFCSNKLHSQQIMDGVIVILKIDTRKVPKWAIEKFKQENKID